MKKRHDTVEQKSMVSCLFLVMKYFQLLRFFLCYPFYHSRQGFVTLPCSFYYGFFPSSYNVLKVETEAGQLTFYHSVPASI